jgi:hypothetical protein
MCSARHRLHNERSAGSLTGGKADKKNPPPVLSGLLHYEYDGALKHKYIRKLCPERDSGITDYGLSQAGT